MAGALDVDRFVAEVREAGREGQRAVDEVLARVVAEPAAVVQGLGAPRTPGLGVLHRADDLTILNVVWAPLMQLLPHDHAMWASIAIYTGREDNILWRRQGERVQAVSAASLCERQVLPLPADAVHSVINPIPRLTGAIHVYGGDFFVPSGRHEWDPETLRERPWDLEAVRASFQAANARFEAGH